MHDIYLLEDGSVHHCEGRDDGAPPRIFRPIAFLGPITIWEEERPPAAVENSAGQSRE